MKIRLLDDSIRLRLRQGELDRLQRQGRIEGATRFGPAPDAAWRCLLVRDAGASPLSVSFEAGLLTIGLDPSVLDALATTDRVGVEHAVALGEAGVLTVCVEKDFKCLSPREEDADAYPHPDSTTGHQC
ncbi:MAG: hypothetical protein R2834_07800 [Rhodothermales bacterium]